MAETKYIRGSDPYDPFAARQVAPSYDLKRGKVTPRAKAAWNQVDGHGKPHDPERGRKLLDEAER